MLPSCSMDFFGGCEVVELSTGVAGRVDRGHGHEDHLPWPPELPAPPWPPSVCFILQSIPPPPPSTVDCRFCGLQMKPFTCFCWNGCQ